jgi:hypothetical protein
LYNLLGCLPLLGQALFALLAGGAFFKVLKYSVTYIKRWWFGSVDGEVEIKQSALDYVNALNSDNPDAIFVRSAVVPPASKFTVFKEGYPNAGSKK